MGQKFSSAYISTALLASLKLIWLAVCGDLQTLSWFHCSRKHFGSWVKKTNWKQGGFVGFLERRGYLVIHSSFCLTFGKIKELHNFELELVGWIYLAFWFQWYSSWDKDSVLPEAFVHGVCSRAKISGLDLNVAKRCFYPVPFLLYWLLCFYRCCVNFTTKTF